MQAQAVAVARAEALPVAVSSVQAQAVPSVQAPWGAESVVEVGVLAAVVSWKVCDLQGSAGACCWCSRGPLSAPEPLLSGLLPGFFQPAQLEKGLPSSFLQPCSWQGSWEQEPAGSQLQKGQHSSLSQPSDRGSWQCSWQPQPEPLAVSPLQWVCFGWNLQTLVQALP